MRYILTLIVLLLAVPSYAGEAVSSLSWTAPETRVDETPLTASEIAEYRVYYAVDATEPLSTASDSIVVTADATERDVTLQLDPRPEPYVVSFAITTVDTEGRESELSETVSKTFDVLSTSPPNPPTNLTLTITCGTGCEVREVQVE